MYIPDERYDIVEEALQDTKRGPVRTSKVLSTMFFAAVAFGVLDLMVLLGSIFFGRLTLEDLQALVIITLLTPAVGLFCFVFGYLRRYRFLLGKKVERAGLALLGIGAINIGAVIMLFFSMF